MLVSTFIIGMGNVLKRKRRKKKARGSTLAGSATVTTPWPIRVVDTAGRGAGVVVIPLWPESWRR